MGLGVAGLAAGLYGCGGDDGGSGGSSEQPKTGGTLRLWETGEPPVLDPVHTTTTVQRQLAPAFSTLIQFDPLREEPVLIADLAEKWEEPGDGLVWTFKLRQGVKFHDGTPFAAEDAKVSIERVISPPEGTPSGLQSFFKAMVDRVEAPDAGTLTVHLKAPNTLFPTMLAFTKIVPKSLAASVMKDVVGTGPYRLAAHEKDVSLKFVRNPDYHMSGRPYLDGIDISFIDSEDAALTAFRGGQLDMLAGIGLQPEQVEILKRDPNVTLYSGPSTIFYGLDLNPTVPPLTDARVRQAIIMAVDAREAAVGVRKEQYVMGGIMPPGPWGLSEEALSQLPGYGKDVAKAREEAKRLLSSAGVSDGLNLKLLAASSGGLRTLALVLQSQLKAINVNLEPEFLESSAYSRERRAGNYVTAVAGGSFPSDDPIVVVGRHFVQGAPERYPGYSNSRVETLYKQVQSETDLGRRRQLANDLDTTILSDFVHVRLFWFTWDAAAGNYVKNVVPKYNPYESFHRHENTWLDQA